MANIDTYLAQIRSAIYGEEVRGSIVNALEAQNNETENNTATAEQALADAETAINNAQTAADTANTAAANADTSGANAVQIAQEGSDEAVRIATEAAESAQNTADVAAENANAAAELATSTIDNQIQSYDITYQASSIGTSAPTGEWTHSIPTVAEGNYLWTRMQYVLYGGDTVTAYAVGKMGSASSGEGGGNLWYGICETAGNTAAKTVPCDGFSIDTGAEVVVKFLYSNTASDITLNVNSTGAYPVFYNGVAVSPGTISESSTYLFVFNGEQYDVVGELTGTIVASIEDEISQVKEQISTIEAIIGDTDISSINDGTVTGAISKLNTSLTDGSVTKVGTASVGSGTKPMYLDSGTPTASSSTVGSSAIPVYMNSGTVTACGYSLSEINSALTNTFQVQTRETDTLTVESSNYASGTLDSNPPSGYTPLGIIGMYTSGTNWTQSQPIRYYLTRSNNVINYSFRNHASSTASITIQFYVLFVKESLM